MIYTINGEQPFQVLSDSFSVSPSQSGYDLYLSADGFNYSRFATVASGTTKQFTGMNNGNYYILSGNTSEVKVNWERDCGGGGGGTAGVSSLDGQTGALTTKTIGGQSILGEGDIPVGGGDYYVDGDSINNYSGVVDEIYHKLSSGETVFVGSKYDYAKFSVAKAEIYEYQEGQSGDTDYLRQEGFSVTVTRTDGADSYLLRYGTFRAFRYEGRDGNGYSAGLSWNENTKAISPLTLTAKISTGGTIYMNAGEDNNTSNLDKLYSLTKEGRNGIIMAKVYDLRINSAIGYTPVRFLGASSGNNDFYSFARFTFDYTDTDGTTYRTLWTWDRSKPMNTRITLDSCEEVSEGGVAQYDLDAMTQAERAEFVAMCENLTDEEREELFVYRDKSICRYDHTEGSGNSFKIGFSDYRQDGWSYPLTFFRHFFVKADGTYESLGNSSYPNVITFDTTYSDTAHRLSNSDGLSPLTPISNLNAGNEGKVAINLRLIIQRTSPAKVVLSSKAWAERTDNLEGRICAEWHYSGNVITAVWNVVEHTATIASWTEVPEGGSGGSKKSFKFNEMTQAELADMYAELTALPSATTNYNALYDFYNFADWNGGGHYRGWKMQGGYPDSQGRLAFSAVIIKENDISQIYFFQTFISSNGTITNRFTEYHLGS